MDFLDTFIPAICTFGLFAWFLPTTFVVFIVAVIFVFCLGGSLANKG